MEVIAENIKRIRKLKDLSQKEISLAVGIPQGQYSRIEGGKVVPTVPTLQKLAGEFGVAITEFFREAGQEPDTVSLSMLDRMRELENLDKEEREAILKVLDMAISRKRLKENLSALVES